jgi:thiol-disulfide isomerase/thioredoxin
LFYPTPSIASERFEVIDDDGNPLQIKLLGAGGSPRLLWPNTLSDGPPGVARTMQRLLDAGFELWLADPLEARFLPHSNDTIRTLPGTTIAAMLATAETHPRKPTLLLAHGRMALPALRAVRLRQIHRADESRADGSDSSAPPGTGTGAGTGRPDGPALDGLVLLYPNLFGPTPAAGDEPELDPIVAASNWPLLIVQPMRGTLRWALAPLLTTLWDNQAAAYALLLPEVRDWYLFHEPGEDPVEDAAAARLPGQLTRAASLLAAARKPEQPLPLNPASDNRPQRANGLRERLEPTPASAFTLTDADGVAHTLADYRGSVTLVNFWASWCPPCVEEIPSMNRLAARYQPTAFRIVSINFQESPQTIRSFMSRVDVDFPVLIDADGAVSRAWRVLAFPSSFILDRQGRVRWSVNSAIPWDEPAVFQLIDQLVAEES